jgi:hypothetical protein
MCKVSFRTPEVQFVVEGAVRIREQDGGSSLAFFPHQIKDYGVGLLLIKLKHWCGNLGFYLFRPIDWIGKTLLKE